MFKTIGTPVDHKNSHNRIFAGHTNFEIRIFEFAPDIGIFEIRNFEFAPDIGICARHANFEIRIFKYAPDMNHAGCLEMPASCTDGNRKSMKLGAITPHFPISRSGHCCYSQGLKGVFEFE